MAENSCKSRERLSMKLSDYAKSIGVSYKTAWRMWKRGELNATQLTTGSQELTSINQSTKE